MPHRPGAARTNASNEECPPEVLAEGFQPGRLVHRRADDGEVEPLGRPDVAVGDVTRVQDDVHGKRGMTGRRFLGVQRGNAGEQRASGVERGGRDGGRVATGRGRKPARMPSPRNFRISPPPAAIAAPARSK